MKVSYEQLTDATILQEHITQYINCILCMACK